MQATQPSSANTTTQYQRLFSLRHLPEHYSGALLDQFGVLHDGTKPYPGAIEGVKYLADRGMKLLIISNSSRRSAGALGNLQRMGFPPNAFCGVITSGEVTHDALLHRRTSFWQQRRKCIHFTWGDRGAISLEGLNLEVTLDTEEADCIIAHGTEALGTDPSGNNAVPTSLDDMKAVLAKCAAQRSTRSIPMVVANPDVVTVHGSELRTMPGTLAQWYKDMGGEVHLMGKPADIIYKGALKMLDLPAEQVLAIGDSLEHDIAGACTAGVDALFIGGGIHANDLDVGAPTEDRKWEEDGTSKAMKELCGRFEAHPRYIIDYFAL